MTVKSRNKINLTFSILAFIVFLLSLGIMIFEIATGNFSFPNITTNTIRNNFVFGFHPYFSLAGILFEMISVAIISFAIFRAFSKTQSSVLTFFLIFLFAEFVDSLRIYLVFFHISGMYTQLLIIAGKFTLFGRLLGPFSLLLTILTSFNEDITNVNRNSLIILLGSIFLAVSIPINTTRILPNFSVSYSFHNLIVIIAIIITAACYFVLFMNNRANHYEQKTSTGFLLISIGYIFLGECSNLFLLILGVSCVSTGIPLYLIQLHNEFLWK